MKPLYYSIMPLLIIGAAIYLLAEHAAWLQSYRQPLLYGAYGLGIAGLTLSFRFNKSSIFFMTAWVLMFYSALVWQEGDRAALLDVLAVTMPLAALLVAVLPERGIFRVRAAPKYLVLLLAAGTTLWGARFGSGDFSMLAAYTLVPPQYTDWTPIHQPALLLFLILFVFSLSFNLARPSIQKAGFSGTLVGLAAILHLQGELYAAAVMSIAMISMMILAVIQESYQMAYIDELTELHGRRALRELFQKTGGTFSVAMVDVDHFKKFNDTHGHDAGDNVLRMVGGKMRKVGGGGKPFRYGGEEFTVVFPGKRVEEVRDSLEALRLSIGESRFTIRKRDRRQSNGGKARKTQKKSRAVKVTVSIGVADNAKNSAGPWDVLKLADKKLYRAKAAGRNRVMG